MYYSLSDCLAPAAGTSVLGTLTRGAGRGDPQSRRKQGEDPRSQVEDKGRLKYKKIYIYIAFITVEIKDLKLEVYGSGERTWRVFQQPATPKYSHLSKGRIKKKKLLNP